jgi:hypothetical protein
MLVAAGLAGVYLLWHPDSADLAAQVFRSDLFADHGFLVWNNDWYAGHYLPGYSVLFPPLGAAIGPRLVGALAAVAAAALFAVLARRHFGSGAWVGSLWFAAAVALNLLTGRMTFALGVALGLAALVALQSRALVLAVLLAVLTSLASPVAGLFVAIAGMAVAIAERPGAAGHDLTFARRGPLSGPARGGFTEGAALAISAGAAIALLALAFPTPGSEPFVLSAFIAVPLFAAAALVLIPPRESELRWGVGLYLAASVLAFIIANPVGGNITRAGALFAGPVMALVLWPRRWQALAVIALPLLWWQLVAPVRDVIQASGEESTARAYYSPLLGALSQRAREGTIRIEIPPTQERWEAAYVAPSFPLARGWLRQLESEDRDLFIDGNLTAAAYRRWLNRRGVSYVALPDADLDYLAEDEADLIDAGLPFLRRLGGAGLHWALYRVERGPGLVSAAAQPGRPSADARIAELGPDNFTLAARRPGEYLVRIHSNRYWRVEHGSACIAERGDWLQVKAKAPGRVEIAAPFTLRGLFGTEPRCSG